MCGAGNSSSSWLPAEWRATGILLSSPLLFLLCTAHCTRTRLPPPPPLHHCSAATSARWFVQKYLRLAGWQRSRSWSNIAALSVLQWAPDSSSSTTLNCTTLNYRCGTHQRAQHRYSFDCDKSESMSRVESSRVVSSRRQHRRTLLLLTNWLFNYYLCAAPGARLTPAAAGLPPTREREGNMTSRAMEVIEFLPLST